MKTTHIYLILFLCLSTLNCCKDDEPTNKEHLLYQVTVSDDCNCDNDLCESSYFLEKLEYERLVKIKNESSEDCVFVNGKGDALGSNGVVIIDFEGYLLRLNVVYLPNWNWF